MSKAGMTGHLVQSSGTNKEDPPCLSFYREPTPELSNLLGACIPVHSLHAMRILFNKNDKGDVNDFQ